MPEVQAQLGTPEQLPYGEAAALNETPMGQTAPELGVPEGAPAAAPAEEEYVDDPGQPGDNEPLFEPADEDEDFLTGPTLRPDEPQSILPLAGRQRVPENVRRNLPLIQAAASEPGADPQLTTLVNFLVREMSR